MVLVINLCLFVPVPGLTFQLIFQIQRSTTIATGFHMSVPNGVAAIGLLGWDTNCGNLGRIIVIIVILVPVSKRV